MPRFKRVGGLAAVVAQLGDHLGAGRVAAINVTVVLICAVVYSLAGPVAARVVPSRALAADTMVAGAVPAFSSVLDPASLNPDLLTTTPEFQIIELCQRQHSQELAQNVLSKINSVEFYTGCASHDWMHRLLDLGGPGDKTFIDIGCNKGYTSAKIFAMWAPELGFKPNNLQQRNPAVVECGPCNDCLDEVTSSIEQSRGAVQVYCVEPNLATFAELVRTKDVFFTAEAPRQHEWHLVHAAISNSSGIARFGRCKSADEMCAFDSNQPGQLGQDKVPVLTVDEMVEKYEMPYVDVLKIDTEGFDALALQGSMGSLSSRRVGMLVFEYHGLGVWPLFKLRDVVQQLRGANFVCYLAGKAGGVGELDRLTDCFEEELEFHGWSNVACVRRDHHMYPEMEKLTGRYAKFQEAYFIPPAGAAA